MTFEDPGNRARPLPSWNAAVPSALPTWVAKALRALWLGVPVVPLGNSRALATVGKLWARVPSVLPTWLRSCPPRNCARGIRCPLLLTERRFRGVVVKKLLSWAEACRPARLIWRAMADWTAPTDPLRSRPDWASELRLLVRLLDPEPRSAFWIAGMRRLLALGRSAAWLESRSAVASIAPPTLALKSASCCVVGVEPLARSWFTSARIAVRKSFTAARTCRAYAVRKWATVSRCAAITPGLTGGDAGGGVTPGCVTGITTVTRGFVVLSGTAVAPLERTSRSSRLASASDGRNAFRFLVSLFMVWSFLGAVLSGTVGGRRSGGEPARPPRVVREHRPRWSK